MITEKAITVVEFDVDRYRSTIFESTAIGGTPPHWSKQWTASDSTLLGIADAGSVSGRAARFTTTGSDALRAWSFDPAGEMRDVSLAVRMYPTSCRLVVRGSVDTTGDEQAYVLHYDASYEEMVISKIEGGVESELASFAFTWPADTPVWFHFDALDTVSGALVRARWWEGEYEDTPDLFTIFYEDATPLPTGWVGVAMTTADDADILFFRARSLFGEVLETYRFAKATAYLPKSLNAIPNVQAVSLEPQRVSIGKDLGVRPKLTVTFKDHPHADQGEGFDYGTFWSKFRARELFRRGLPVRLKFGTVDTPIEEWESRFYVMDSFDGPNSNSTFALNALDPLKLLDNERAQCPRMSNGFLNAAITNSQTSAVLAPSGIGDEEYPSSGYLAIGGKEIVSFTRSGNNLTITRGRFGTTGQAHDAQDRVQVCQYYDAESAADIIYDLATEFAEVPAEVINKTNWDAEMTSYLPLVYTRMIAEPTGVQKLVSEMIEQAGLSLWTNDITNRIQLRVLRPVSTEAAEYNQQMYNRGSINVAEQRSLQLTQVWTYYGVRNPLENLEEGDNYRSSFRLVDGEQESKLGQAAIRKVWGTWIPALARDQASRTSNVLLGRYSIPPRKFGFDIQRFTGIDIPLIGEPYHLRYTQGISESLQSERVPILVTRTVPLADKLAVEAEEMRIRFLEAPDLINRTIIIDSNTLDVRLPALHNSIYPPLTDEDVSNGVNLTVIIADDVIVGATRVAFAVNAAGGPAFNVGSSSDWPTGFPIHMILNGRIQGYGGNGIRLRRAPNNNSISAVLTPAQDGGTALYSRYPFTFESGPNGQIWGGGGGGGRGQLSGYGRAGGGGQGSQGGWYGERSWSSGSATGSSGSPSAPGTGENGINNCRGGFAGQAGEDQEANSSQQAGAGGRSIDGVSYMTGSGGDRRGSQVN